MLNILILISPDNTGEYTKRSLFGKILTFLVIFILDNFKF